MRFLFLPVAAAWLIGNVGAQQPVPPQASLATVSTQGVTLSGSLSVADGRATIGNDGSVTAGEKTADLALTRGGDLKVCASTKIHLSTDTTTPGGGLMIALDRGSFEAHYVPGPYSDVILTPDLRILISGPGQADVSLRINAQGDTCLDNHGDQAPYILASNLFEGGAYRVQPNQRVLFEHGSLRDVVDNEQEPCGCPRDQPVSVASAGVTGADAAKPGEKVAANPTAAQNPFPLAESEGLQPPPAPASAPEAPAGQTHMEVTAPLAYDANHPEAIPPASTDTATGSASASPTAAGTAQAPVPAKPHVGFFHHIGRFFKRMFGG